MREHFVWSSATLAIFHLYGNIPFLIEELNNLIWLKMVLNGINILGRILSSPVDFEADKMEKLKSVKRAQSGRQIIRNIAHMQSKFCL